MNTSTNIVFINLTIYVHKIVNVLKCKRECSVWCFDQTNIIGVLSNVHLIVQYSDNECCIRIGSSFVTLYKTQVT